MVTALVVVVVLTVLTAVYVAAEFSAISVRRSRVRQLSLIHISEPTRPY